MDNPVTTFVKDNKATIICPACNKAKTVQVASFRQKRHHIRVRCACGEIFTVLLDFRSHYRKSVNLSGTYEIKHQREKAKGAIHITNISLSGIRFTVSGLNLLQPGYLVSLDFQLDDRKQSCIRRLAIVRSVHGNRVGCEFIREEGQQDRDLAFYLRC